MNFFLARTVSLTIAAFLYYLCEVRGDIGNIILRTGPFLTNERKDRQTQTGTSRGSWFPPQFKTKARLIRSSRRARTDLGKRRRASWTSGVSRSRSSKWRPREWVQERAKKEIMREWIGVSRTISAIVHITEISRSDRLEQLHQTLVPTWVRWFVHLE